MRRSVLAFMAVGFGFLCAVAPAFAHHSFAAEYDSKKPIKITGTVTKMEWLNPHIYYYVDVKDANGKVVNYAVEGGTPNGLRRQGWGKDSLKVGETVEYALGERRHGYLVPASGVVEVNGVRIDARDGAAIKDVPVVRITAMEDSEVVMVDAP